MPCLIVVNLVEYLRKTLTETIYTAYYIGVCVHITTTTWSLKKLQNSINISTETVNIYQN
jgi:hypothetical protein